MFGCIRCRASGEVICCVSFLLYLVVSFVSDTLAYILSSLSSFPLVLCVFIPI